MKTTAKNQSDPIRECRELRAQIESHYLRQELAWIENRQEAANRRVNESWHEPTWGHTSLADVPFHHGSPVMPDVASDRASGDFRPVFQTEWDLAAIRGVAHFLAQSAFGQGILGNLRNYIIHTGFDYAATARRGQHVPLKLVRDVQQIINTFLADNLWELDFEQELCDAEHIDGEVILVLEQNADQVRVRRAEPAWLTEPADTDYLERRLGSASRLNWRYGIATDEADATQIHGYFIQWNGDAQSWRFYSPRRVMHLKANTPRHVKRGLSDFYPVQSDLNGATELLRRMMKGAGIQASIAMIIEAVQGSGGLGIGDATNLGASLARSNSSGGGRLRGDGRYQAERISDWSAGTVIDTKGKKFQAGPMAGAQAANFVQVLNAGLRTAGVRWNLPEHMISGDASNNNYASILESSSPFVRKIEAAQERLSKAYERMLWSVIRMQFESGRLNLHRYGMTWTDLVTCLNVIVTGSSPAVRNRAEEFQVDAQLHEMGIVSRHSLATKYDWDPTEEQEKSEPSPVSN